MRRNRFQMTLQMMMISIASIALALAVGPWCAKLWRDSKTYRQKSQREGALEQVQIRAVAKYREQLRDASDTAERLKADGQAFYPQGSLPPRLMPDDAYRDTLARLEISIERHEAALRFFARLADYHARLRQKYDQAARRPWLRVEPDGVYPQ